MNLQFKNRISDKLLTKFLFLAISFFGQSVFAQGYTIQVKVDGTQDLKCYLGSYYGNSTSIVDSADVKGNGHFLFQGRESLPKGIYFVYSPNIYFEILINDQNFSVEVRSPNFVTSMKTYDSEENKIYNQLQRFAFQQRNLISALTISLAEVDTGNTLALELKKVEASSRDFQKKLAEKHSGLFISKVIMAMMEPEIPKNLSGNNQFTYLRRHFFDNFDFSEPGLLRTPFVVDKYEEYLGQYTHQAQDSIINSINQLMKRVDGFPEFYRFTVSFLIDKYMETKPQVFLHVALNFLLNKDTRWMDQKLLTEIKQKVDRLIPKNTVGDLATDFSLIDLSFNKITLYSISAKYLILYFYDPDCHHCQEQTPILFDIYSKYKNQGLEVLAVCVTTDVQRWREFIAEGDWDWINAADPYFNSSFRDDYQVYTAPMLYILDGNKEVLASNIPLANLGKFMTTLKF